LMDLLLLNESKADAGNHNERLRVSLIRDAIVSRQTNVHLAALQVSDHGVSLITRSILLL
jgi:hypothetical protein